MSLVRLLAAGKSLVGLNDGTGRYRVTDKGLLPKFGTAKNPFRATVRPPSHAAAPPSGQEPATSGDGSSQAAPAKTEPKQAGSQTAAIRRVGTSPSRLQRITSLLFLASGRPEKCMVTRASKLPVQGELSLETVRVVRNDLSDADLEVVPVKSPPKPSPAPVPVPVCQQEERVPASTQWEGDALRLAEASKA